MNILTIDVGGSHIKVLVSHKRTPRKVDSGPSMTPARMVKVVKELTADWSYDAISIGYPGPVSHGKIAAEPRNLTRGWTRFDFASAFGCPVKLINDAAMQALVSYDGGHMLFLGFGTGLGSAMIVNGELAPLEFAHLPYRKGLEYEDYVGAAGLKRLGQKKWRKHVWTVVGLLRQAVVADYVVVGGGNAKVVGRPPKGVRIGKNTNAFTGGFRLWNATDRVPAKNDAQLTHQLEEPGT